MNKKLNQRNNYEWNEMKYDVFKNKIEICNILSFKILFTQKLILSISYENG